ncbi:hypothetical protein [Sorangium sp. So ce513]|uniref:hypothetical protein n=1 Tax=Sorangium sp. So ce513 TaxID=3133315 RepID=UPI003F618B96
MEQVRSRLAAPRAPTAPLLAARRRLAAWALALAAAAAAPTAAAQTPTEGAAHPSTAPPPPASPPPPAPPPSASPGLPGIPPGATWDETVAAYEAHIASLERQARSAAMRGSEEAVRRIELDLQAARRAYRDFEERTTEPNSPFMMVSGLVLSGLGGVAVITGLVLVVAKHDDTGADARDRYTVALATAAGGAVGLGVGLPLYVIGKKRVRKDIESSAPLAARLLVGPGAVAAAPGAGPLSVGLRVAF